MAEVYRNLLVIICLGLLGWGIVRMERIYQYPFFMGSVFVSFLLPQAFALVDNPRGVSQTALERVLLMSCLCAAACWVGYQADPNQKWLSKLTIEVSPKRLYRANIFLMLVGNFFYLRISGMAIQTSETNGNWTGAATIYIFFAQVVYIAFAFFLLEALKRPTLPTIIFTILAGWRPYKAVLGGRRQPTLTFLIIIGLALFLVRRYIPSRWLIILGVFVMMIIMPVVGALRGDFWNLVLAGQWQEVYSATQQNLDQQQTGEILELRNAAFYMDATAQENLYGLGAGWWDAIVFQYIPGQIVGFFIKQTLQFNLISESKIYDLYGYYIPIGTTPTGPGDIFREFGYLGCLAYAALGYIFKHLWISATYHKSVISKLLYMSLISPAMISISHGFGRFFQEAIFQVGVIITIAYYSRLRLKARKLFIKK